MAPEPTSPSPKEELLRLIYVSSSIDLLPDSEITQILEASRRNNQRDGITGMLLYYEGSFLQVLEGPADQVEATFRRIESDPRHRGMINLARLAISERDFGDWSMGFSRPGAHELSDLPGANDFFRGAKCLEMVSEGTAKRILTRFRANAR